MKEVKIKKEVLLERIKKNRDKHHDVFVIACDEYRKQAIIELDKMLNMAKSGNKIRRMVELIEPEDHGKDYDRVIDMLTLSDDEVITLSEYDFGRYVRDEWEWVEQFNNSTMSYLAKDK